MLSIIFKIIKRLVLLFLISTILSVLLLRFIPIPFTPLVFTRMYEQYHNNKEIVFKKNWVPIDKISKQLQRAVISSEDQNFVEHHGFDFDAIGKAYDYNKNKKGSKPAIGASTISQQTAKNVFLWQGRTYIRKALEAYFTVLIELIWSKERILEVYLNVIEMGDGIYGAEAASQLYFHVPAEQLSRQQAAAIAAILPNPRRWNAAKPNGKLKYKINKIVSRMPKAKLPKK
jgi:monofunctional glycosyltransferase